MAQYGAFFEDYTMMTKDATSTEYRVTILATALALEKAHGRRLAAAYLNDVRIAAKVIVELLYGLVVEGTQQFACVAVDRKRWEGPAD